ncbi:class II aldolase/adducin family protein [Stomatohabitans albus]|uniref:class II aldolase/adducin family protein n=1 Tax=Stomatohabitans albus TaxID=3110766 RepID=UPI00300D8CC9
MISHPIYGVVLGTLRRETPLIHYMLAPMGGAVRVAPYAQFGTQELADNVLAAAKDRSAVLMENHGAIAWGKDLASAYSKCAYLEWCCEVWCKAAAIGDPHLLSTDQVESVVQGLASYSPIADTVQEET